MNTLKKVLLNLIGNADKKGGLEPSVKKQLFVVSSLIGLFFPIYLFFIGSISGQSLVDYLRDFILGMGTIYGAGKWVERKFDKK
jgi:hypothetical protein